MCLQLGSSNNNLVALVALGVVGIVLVAGYGIAKRYRNHIESSVGILKVLEWMLILCVEYLSAQLHSEVYGEKCKY